MHEFNVIINIFVFMEKARFYPTLRAHGSGNVGLQPGKFKSAEMQTAWSVCVVYFHHYNFHKSYFLTTLTTYGYIDICADYNASLLIIIIDLNVQVYTSFNPN